MNIEEYSQSIVSKLSKNPMFYSEIPKVKLKKIFQEYLDDFYDTKISDIMADYEDKKDQGLDIDKQFYQNKIDEAKAELYKKAYDLARTVK